jgi:hypothetical protein
MARTKVLTDEQRAQNNIAYRNTWQKENFDRLNVQVVKGKRDQLKAYAQQNGYAGYAEYIRALVKTDSGIDLYEKV